MGIWAELGIFGLALALGLWQLWDVNKARKQSRQLRGNSPTTQRPGPNDTPRQAPGQAAEESSQQHGSQVNSKESCRP